MADRTVGSSYEELCDAARGAVREIDPAECLRLQAEGALVVDVREPDEWADGVVADATLVPRGVLEKEIGSAAGELDRIVCLYCASGKRSLLAASSIGKMGYREVVSVAGGFERWQAESHPIAAGPAPTYGAPRDTEEIDPADWGSIRRNFAITSRRVTVLDGTERPLVYLDHAATTHPPDVVVRRVEHFLRFEYANVHRATYQLARRSTMQFEDAYRTCGRFVGADLDHHCVVFTSNTTAACEIVAHAVADRDGAVLVTDLEHHSGDLPHRRRGRVVRIGLDDAGRLDMATLKEALRRERIKLVAITGAANVTGWMPPIHEIARLAHEAGALVSVDAAQLLAHAPVSMGTPGDPESIDFLVAAGHKAYAPFGSGFLVGPRSILDAVDPVVPGGGVASSVDEDGATWLRSPDRHQFGTPNVGGAIGMAAMLEVLESIGMDAVRRHEIALFDRLLEGMRDIGGLELYGPPEIADRVGIVPFNVDGVSDMLTAAVLGEEFAIAVRNGRFCSHVHSRHLMGPEGDRGAVRASIGLYNDESDIDGLLEALEAVRAGRWSGTYEERGSELSGQWGGRCADRWMEGATGSSPAPDGD